MNDSKKQLILTGSLSRAILTLAIPIMLNNLIGTLYNLGDAFWVSKIGDVEVAAINFIWPVAFFTQAIVIGISVAGGSIISQYIGASNQTSAKETAQQLYVFSLLFGIVSGILGWFLTPSIMQLMHATGALYDNSVSYLRILFIEMPFLFILNIYFSINQAQGDTLTPMIVNGSSAVLNIILDPIFIFVFDLGIEGAAIATVLSKVPFALYGMYHLSQTSNHLPLQPFNLKPQLDKLKDLIRIGIPSSIGSASVAFGFMIMHVFLVDYGDYTIAAVGIGNRLNSLAFMPAIGIGAALSTIVGQNLGAKNLLRIRKAFHTSLLLSFLFLCLTGSILWFFSTELVGIFSTTPEVLNIGSYYLKILAVTTWSISFFNCSIGLFNGSGHTSHSMFLEAGRLWIIRIPLIIGLAFIPALKTDGILYAIGASNILSGAIAYLLTFSNVWKQPKIKTLNI
jgi:putative MATE family efflux protein